jgi:hypothetical protein
MSDAAKPALSRPEPKRVRLPSAMNFPPPSERQARIMWAAVTGLAWGILIALAGLVLLAIGWVAQQLSPVLLPLAIAAIIAYVLDPVVGILEQRGLPRTRAIICVFAFAALMVAGLAASVAPTVVIETRQLVERIPTYAERMHERVDSWVTNPPVPLQHMLNLRPAPVPEPPVPAPFDNSAPPEAPEFARDFWAAFDPGALQSATEWLGRVLPKVGSWLFGQGWLCGPIEYVSAAAALRRFANGRRKTEPSRSIVRARLSPASRLCKMHSTTRRGEDTVALPFFHVLQTHYW